MSNTPRSDDSPTYLEALPDGGVSADDEGCEPALFEAKKLWSQAHISAETDPLSAYLNRLNHLEPLPSDTQQELAVRYKEHQDQEAAKLLVLTNLRLVVKLAKEYQRRKTDLLELIQQGNLGLSEALTRYDPYRGVKFTSYAQYWIRAMILNYLMNYTHPVRIGGSRAGRKLFYNLKKARRTLMQNGHKPTASRVAEYLDVREAEVVRVAAQLDAPPVYLDAEAPGHEETTVGELMEADSISPESAAAEYDLSSQISEVISEYGDGIEDTRKQAIWNERMVADDAKTLAELGEDWGVSKERIRQIEVGMRKDFRSFLVERLGDDIELEWLQAP
ncbi:MAG: sigma-70 family RNA polymerase sigma factor [Persicimonas sp.]